jgi:hypothetical protein
MLNYEIVSKRTNTPPSPVVFIIHGSECSLKELSSMSTSLEMINSYLGTEQRAESNHSIRCSSDHGSRYPSPGAKFYQKKMGETNL